MNFAFVVSKHSYIIVKTSLWMILSYIWSVYKLLLLYLRFVRQHKGEVANWSWESQCSPWDPLGFELFISLCVFFFLFFFCCFVLPEDSRKAIQVILFSKLREENRLFFSLLCKQLSTLLFTIFQESSLTHFHEL